MTLHRITRVTLGTALMAALLFMTVTATGQAQAGGSVCPPNPDPVDPNNPVVIVDRPSEGEAVSSPMRVEGQAHVFEAELSLELFDAHGNTLAEGRTMAGGGELQPYAHDLAFTVPTTQPGCLRAFQVSAEDGSPITAVQIEVELVAEFEATPGPPDTGAGTATGGHEAGSMPLMALVTIIVFGAGAAGLATYRSMSGKRQR